MLDVKSPARDCGLLLPYKGPRNPHTLRRLQRELLYDDADRIDSWGLGQELEVEGCFAPPLQWVPTGGRELD